MNRNVKRSASAWCSRASVRSLAVCLLIALSSCCKPGPTARHLGPRTETEPLRQRGLYCELAGGVRVIDAARDPLGDACRAAGGTVYLLVERDPLLRNDTRLKSEIMQLRTSSAWANPDPMPGTSDPSN